MPAKDECPACHKNWNEHQPGYSAQRCGMKPPTTLDLDRGDILTIHRLLQEEQRRLRMMTHTDLAHANMTRVQHAAELADIEVTAAKIKDEAIRLFPNAEL